MRLRILTCFAALMLGGLPMVSAQDSSDITLAVYNAGAALIRDQRTLSLDEGINTVELRDVAATIDPTSINFRSLSDPAGIAVLEQSYIPDQLNAGSLLSRYLSETVSITADNGTTYSGELLRISNDKAIVRTESSQVAFISLYDIGAVQLPALPEDLRADARLRIKFDAANAGQHDAELTYLAGGINWTADYSLFLAADETSLDLSGLVTLQNRSGRGYRDANLKLVAGEVSRIEQEEFAEPRMMALSAAANYESESIEAQDFSDYKLYHIPRPVSIEDGETKQLEFVAGRGIAADVSYVFDSSPSSTGYYSPITRWHGRESERGDVRTYLTFETGDEQGLGADLPAGRARVYKADVDGARLLIGESQVQHTAKGEAVALQIGTAFDLTGERTQTDFTFVSRLVAQEKFEIRLRNRKEHNAVEIAVPERLYRWRDWQIIESSLTFTRVDQSSIEFALTVEPGAEAVLTYTVQYSFPEEDE